MNFENHILEGILKIGHVFNYEVKCNIAAAKCLRECSQRFLLATKLTTACWKCSKSILKRNIYFLFDGFKFLFIQAL
jgi:hypothetical protein